MTYSTPLAMSETKANFIKHLGLPSHVYAKMGKEVDRIYNWLTSDPYHLKDNSSREPPYDWSDISERSKDQAIGHIVGDASYETSGYWALAEPTQDCSNWIAKWFLYHKFRYRDGRSRQTTKNEKKSKTHQRSEKDTNAGQSWHTVQHQHSYGGSGSQIQGSQTPYYDPVRDVREDWQ